VHLSSFFSGTSADELSLVAPGFFALHGARIELKLNAKAAQIDRAAKTVTLADGAVLAYDKLVFATGSTPFVPPVPGRERKDCFVYRTIEDLEAMLECGARGKSGVVIGGGLLGLECAKALRDMRLDTHVVEFAPRLMAVQVDDLGGRVLRNKIEEIGVTVHTQKNTLRIVDGESATHRMEFADGSFLETDMIVFSAGIRPRDELARACGLDVGPRGGIAIGDDCLSSDADIYAIGECAAWKGQTFGLVAPGYDMARTVARALLGQEGTFAGADMSTKLKLMGVDVASIGDAHAAAPGARSFQYTDERKQVYKKIVVSDCGKRLLGAVLVGDAEEYGTLLQMMLNGMALPAAPEFLILPQLEGGARPAIGVDALPAGAQVCSCNAVTKGAIADAVAGGACDIGAIKTCTNAGTSCGGCVPLVTQIMKAEMKKAGLAVSNHLCEHFPYSRQELHHLIRVGSIKSFGELLHKHGKGLGCDICKPVAANILASTWNDFVLKPAARQPAGFERLLPRQYPEGRHVFRGAAHAGRRGHAGRPDRRRPGRQEIRPVHQDHGRPARRPVRRPRRPAAAIWEELIAAGFESGHAYGKSLRTVKSCVGSTWCRFGVGDSVGFAVALENRYKGLRAPHKIKFGVSGCTRECAEAQGKDVGLIATDKGWNLYVCGNGGMKPRHAELLASDLDEATVVKLVDRFLMFYVRTGDRLQRTSTWRENLEGGLDYLKPWSWTTDWASRPSWKPTCSAWSTPMRTSGRTPSRIRPCASASAPSSTARTATPTSCSCRNAARSARPPSKNAAAPSRSLPLKENHHAPRPRTDQGMERHLHARPHRARYRRVRAAERAPGGRVPRGRRRTAPVRHR
jgi:nitrite reductase (NADH) large subunit